MLTRRTWLGASVAAGAVAIAAAANAGPSMPVWVGGRQAGKSHHDYGAAMDALRVYASAELQAIGLPGMTLCAVDADGFAILMTFGWADLDRRIPVSAGHFFQIGSISKAFSALTVFHLAEAGKIDLAAPMSKYLPDAMLPEEPITVAQVLSHIAGLPDGAPIFPRVPDGRLWTGFKPGSHFSYSNTGYELIGHLIDRVAGIPHPEAIRQTVFAPLGMDKTEAVIDCEDRAKFAVGYIPFYQDRPQLTQVPLAVSPWTDEDTSAGSIVSTADQMANYLRFLLTLDAGKSAPILSDRSAQLFAKPVTDAAVFGPKARYGNGLATVPIDGKPCLHHTGGMICYTSSFHADPAAGVACFASVNASIGDYRPRKTTAFAVQLMRAVRAGAAMPKAPDPMAKLNVPKPDEFGGRFVPVSGETFEIVVVNGKPELRCAGQTGRLELADKDTLMTDHPLWARHLFAAHREHGKITSYWWGNQLIGRDAKHAQPQAPARLQALAGTYLNRDPWVGQTDVLVQGNRLVVEGLSALVETRGGYWKPIEDKNPERFAFDAELNGRATRLSVSGNDQLRVF